MNRMLQTAAGLYLLFLIAFLQKNTMAQDVTGFSGSTLVGAQKSYDPRITPANPEAFSFTRYGNLPVGLVSGTAQFNIPVYTIKSGKLTHNISLNYSTNGVKVEEVASREGMNWVLKTGGVIRRTVLGRPDENGTRTFYHGTVGDNASFYDYVRLASASAFDFQPDEYFYDVDGLTGKFLKGENGNFKQFNASATKIETSNGFLITSANGIKYYFQAADISKGYNENEVYEIGQEPIPAVTAWFLTKIVSPEGDSIRFNYSTLLPHANVSYHTGITQTYATYLDPDLTYQYVGAYGGYMTGYACMEPAPYFVTTKVNKIEYSGFYLTSIDFNEGKVQFVYSSRQDLINEVKLDTIKVLRNADNKLIKCFALGHVYSYAQPGSFDTHLSLGSPQAQNPELRKRLFLTGFSELSADLSQSNTYEFTYDDINGLPPRLSFAQDAFGNFNGKANTYFFPYDTWVDDLIGGNNFGGDRSYSFMHAKKGALTKIKYPTGGYSVFDYEPHRVKSYTPHKLITDSLSASIPVSIMMNETVETDTFMHNGNRRFRLKIYCDWAGEPAEFFPDAYFAYFSIIDVSTGTCAYKCEQVVWPGTNYIDGTLAWRLPAGTYKIVIKASMPTLRIISYLEKEQWVPDISPNAGIGGVRIKAVTDYGADNAESNRREFFYTNWDNPASSSGSGLYHNTLNAHFTSAIRTLGSRAGGLSDPNGQNTIYCGYTTINSSSLNSLYLTDNSTAMYETVLELNHAANGENNGGTEYSYHVENRLPAAPLGSGSPLSVWDFSPILIEGSPYNNNDFKNGMLLNRKTFTYQQKFGQRTFLQETSNYYSLAPTPYSIDTLFAIREVLKRDMRSLSWRYFYDYDINVYYRHYGWLRLDSVVEKNYNNGNPALTNRKSYTYSDKNYLTKTESAYNSRNELTTVSYAYPPDKAQPAGQQANIYNLMSDANMVDARLESVYSNGTELSRNKINYGIYNNRYLPASIEKSFNGLPLENEVIFNQYDAGGNLLQYTGRNGVRSVFLWNYNNQYVIAEAKNATIDQTAYTSFEGADWGGWSMTPGSVVVTNTNAITGRNTINGGVQKNVPADNYVVGVWSTGNTSINGQLQTQTPVKTVGSWRYFEILLTNVTTVTVTGDNIDEVKLHPENAQMTTYTYDPLVGVTSQCDATGRITYYEYDGFGRLKTIRDEDKNILKTFDYQFQKNHNQ